MTTAAAPGAALFRRGSVPKQLNVTFQPNPSAGVFQCVVRFEGGNVLEGLRDLIPRGAANVGRLPKFLATLPEKLTSHLVVTDSDMTAVPAAEV